MFGAALASSLNIGCAIDSTFEGEASATMGTMELNCVVMQDDIAKMNDDLKGAREGCYKRTCPVPSALRMYKKPKNT